MRPCDSCTVVEVVLILEKIQLNYIYNRSNQKPPFPSPVLWSGNKWTKGATFNPAYEMGSPFGETDGPQFNSRDQKVDIKFSDREPNKQVSTALFSKNS